MKPSCNFLRLDLRNIFFRVEDQNKKEMDPNILAPKSTKPSDPLTAAIQESTQYDLRFMTKKRPAPAENNDPKPDPELSCGESHRVKTEPDL